MGPWQLLLTQQQKSILSLYQLLFFIYQEFTRDLTMLLPCTAVAKPKFIDGTASSHALSLAFNNACLSELKPPLVLQEFINHGKNARFY